VVSPTPTTDPCGGSSSRCRALLPALFKGR
jgi:hypothetical protein